MVRPHICWFGEVPFEMELVLHQLREAIGGADGGKFGSGGAGGELCEDWRDSNGARTIYVGPEEPANRAYFDEVLRGKAGEVLPRLVENFLRNEVSRDVVGGEGRYVCHQGHVDELRGGPLPSVSFAAHDRQG